MAIRANGSLLSHERYEFGVRWQDGGLITTAECGTKDEADALASAEHGEVVFRAVYVTGWEETL